MTQQSIQAAESISLLRSFYLFISIHSINIALLTEFLNSSLLLMPKGAT